jgi:hypothetical protein
MRDALDAAKQRLAREIDSKSALPSKPIAADPWVVSSPLQKSIRRGERELTRRAAFTIFHLKGAAVWRRLMVIAFEDVGIGSIDALTTTVAAAGDSAWRKSHGGDLRLVAYLAGLLAEAPKDRSLPLYALDKHTRLGREAIWRFACENDSARACLARFVPASKRRSAAYVAAFYVDAAPVARRLMWDQSKALEAFGIKRDLLHAGVPADGIEPVLDVMRVNLGHLNELRAQVLASAQKAAATMQIARVGAP